MQERERFDIDALDPEEPFEIDRGNRPHLYKHLLNETGRPIGVGVEDLYEVYLYSAPVFFEAQPTGAADWLMVGAVPGICLVVPLAPPNSGDPTKCRPIGIYRAKSDLKTQYENWTY